MIKTQPLLVIVPALNEQDSIQQVVHEIRTEHFDVLVVDDGSTDNTARRAKAAGAMVLRLPVNLGVGGALRAGFRFAVDNNYAAVVQVDADGQHPVSQIRDLISAAERNSAHIVIGSRFISSDASLVSSSSRKFAMWILSKLVSHEAGHVITDTTSGFRLISEPLLSEFARQFPAHYLGDTFEVTIGAVRANYSVIEVPASLKARVYGRSSSGTLTSILLIVRVIVTTLFRIGIRFHSCDQPQVSNHGIEHSSRVTKSSSVDLI